MCTLAIVETSTDAAAAACDYVIADASGGDVVVTAPSAPDDGAVIAVRKGDDSANTVQLQRADTSTVIELVNELESVVYRWNTAGGDWVLVAHDLGVVEEEFPPSPIDIDPYYYYVTALLRGNGADTSTVIADDAGNPWTPNGNVQILGNEIACDGNGDYLACTLQEGILGVGDLTIEAWVTIPSFAGGHGCILCISDPTLGLSTFTLVFEYRADGALRGSLQNGSGVSNVDLTSAAGVLVANTKAHVCLTAEGTTARLRVGGVVVASGTITGSRSDGRTSARIGYLTSDLGGAHQRFFNGKIEDLRVTRGICRYPGPGAITPPAPNPPHVPAPRLLSTFNTATLNDAQGVCTDGVHVWYSSSNTLYKFTRAGALVTSRNVAGDPPVTGKTNALGGPQTNGLYIRNGVLYVSIAQYLSNTPASWVAEYDPDTLTLINSHALASYGFSEGLAWGQDSWWVPFHADMRLAQYDASWNLIAEHFLDQTVTGSSGGYGPGTGYDGIAWVDDLVYLNIHETYNQKYLDVFQFNGHRFTRVHRQRRCNTYATQGLCINPADPTEMFLALRLQSGNDAIALARLVP